MKPSEKDPVSIDELFRSLFPPEMSDPEIVERLCAMDSHPRIGELRACFCSYCLMALLSSYEYRPNVVFSEEPSYRAYCRVADMLDPEERAYKGYAAFFRGKKETAQRLLFSDIESTPPSTDDPVGENELAWYFMVFKDRFPSFWPALKAKYSEYGVSQNILDLCDLIPRFCSGSPEEKVDLLTKHLSDHPESQFARELLGSVYFSMKRWNNTIACLEDITEPVFIHAADMLWYLGISSYKIRDYSAAEGYYRECLEMFPNEEGILNCLGYVLLRQKKYQDALTVFEKCLSEERDLPYSANNCVKTLLYLGRTKDALELIQSGKYRFDKSLTDKVIEAHKKGVKEKPSALEDDENETPVGKRVLSAVRGSTQFMNEKLLEDELEAKISAGVPIFGKKLNVFRRKGEYGRQYCIPNGRVDLLCEDDEGNLYIVELKRDSGYDDVYAQTVRYLDWFGNNKRFKGKKVTGIICLNSPSRELIERVRGDGRIRLFEYSIQYSEVL